MLRKCNYCNIEYAEWLYKLNKICICDTCKNKIYSTEDNITDDDFIELDYKAYPENGYFNYE
mgnify:CR=1 FL=1